MRDNYLDILFTFGFLTVNLFIVLLVPSVFLEKNLKNPCPNNSISDNIKKYIFINKKGSKFVFAVCFIIYGIMFISYLLFAIYKDIFPLFNSITIVAAIICLISSLIYLIVLPLLPANRFNKPVNAVAQLVAEATAPAPPSTSTRAAASAAEAAAAEAAEAAEAAAEAAAAEAVEAAEGAEAAGLPVTAAEAAEAAKGAEAAGLPVTAAEAAEAEIRDLFSNTLKVKISVGTNGHVWRVDKDKKLFCCLYPCNGDWKPVDDIPNSAPIKSISCGKSFVYIITKGVGGVLNKPWKKASDNTGAWTQLDNTKNFKQISSGPNDEVYGIVDGNIYKFKDPLWVEITSSNVELTGKAKEIFVGPDDVWVKSSGEGEYYYWKRSIADTASDWVKLSIDINIGSPSISNDGKHFWGLREGSYPYISGITTIDDGPTERVDSENTSKFIALSAGKQETWGIKEDETIWKTSVDNTSEPNYWVQAETKTLSRVAICSNIKGVNNYIKYHRNIIVAKTLSILSSIVIFLNYEYGIIPMIIK